MLQDYTGLLTGDEWFVKEVNKRNWEMTVRKSHRSEWYTVEIHEEPEDLEPDMYYGPIAHREGRNLAEVCRDTYLEAIGELEPWIPLRY